MEVVDADDLIVITDKGVLMRQPVSSIRTIGRVTQGVKLVKLDDGSKISSISRVINEAEHGDNYDKTKNGMPAKDNEDAVIGGVIDQQEKSENNES
jgi:DNA gyrase subunit A